MRCDGKSTTPIPRNYCIRFVESATDWERQPREGGIVITSGCCGNWWMDCRCLARSTEYTASFASPRLKKRFVDMALDTGGHAVYRDDRHISFVTKRDNRVLQEP